MKFKPAVMRGRKATGLLIDYRAALERDGSAIDILYHKRFCQWLDADVLQLIKRRELP